MQVFTILSASTMFKNKTEEYIYIECNDKTPLNENLMRVYNLVINYAGKASQLAWMRWNIYLTLAKSSNVPNCLQIMRNAFSLHMNTCLVGACMAVATTKRSISRSLGYGTAHRTKLIILAIATWHETHIKPCFFGFCSAYSKLEIKNFFLSR